MAVELARLARIAEEAPALVGGGHWTEVTLASCAEIARLYAELKRRHHAERARALMGAALRQFVESSEQGSGQHIGVACETRAPAL